MLRSFLARSQPLLRRPARCGAGDTTVLAPVLGRSNRRILPSRAYASDASSEPEAETAATPRCNSAAHERTSPALSSNRHRQGCCCCPRPRRHLYVVLDEVNTGHSLYKLNIEDLDGGDEDAITGAGVDADEAVRTAAPRRLPEAVLRLGISSVGPDPRFEALGSKIVITGVSTIRPVLTDNPTRITLVYDTKTAKLDMGHPPPESLVSQYRAVSAGDKLCVLEARGGSPVYLSEELSSLALNDTWPGGFTEDSIMSSLSLRGQTKEWAWRRGPSPPLSSMHMPVKSYAVHPDGRTIFASASSSFTYCLDTESNESSRCGDWCLPFHGRAYYDRDLDAWVGIRRSDNTDVGTQTSDNIDGGDWGTYYLCSCDVPAALADGTTPPPAWKMCKEELTFLEPSSTCVSRRTLVHTGRGRFCLVELTPAHPFPPLDSHCICFHDGIQHLLRVTMFRAKHGKNGEPLHFGCDMHVSV